jgi:hypothetical protein
MRDEYLSKASTLMAYATKQYGFADREYRIVFGELTPYVYVHDEDTDNLIAEVWLVNDEVQVRKHY